LRRIGTFTFLILGLFAQAPAFASGPGTTAASFLKIPVGARETALGGALTAAADNSGAVYYNPAGLGLLARPEFSFSYNKYVEGVSQQWLAAAYPYGPGAFGFGLNYLNAGSFDSYDNSNNRTGSVSAYDLAAYLSYGGRIEPGYAAVRSILYGASVKYISEKLDTEKAAGYGLDLGFIVIPRVKNLKFGLGFDNPASSRIKFIDEGAKLPFKVKTGIAYAVAPDSPVSSVLFLFDLIFPGDGARYAALGIENLLYRTFSLRAGYSSFGDLSNGMNFGLGVNLAAYTGADLGIDYSFGSSYDFGNIQKLGITYKFGNPARGIKPAAAAPAELAATLPEPEPGVSVSSAAAPAKPAAEQPLKESGSSFKTLLGMLGNEDPEIVRDGINFLAALNDPRATDPLIALLYSENIDIKLAALSGLARQGDERAQKAVEGRLRDIEPRMRMLAAEVLGGRGGESAGKALEGALRNESDDKVKSAIIKALQKLNRW